MEDVMGGECGTYGAKYYKVLAERSGGKRPNTISNLRWEDKIIVHLKEK
jgi:hypothetical protein